MTADFNTDDIIDGTLDALRDQRDDAQQLDHADSVTYNPQVFNAGIVADPTVKPSRPHFLIGPILFPAPFNTAPTITFGQTAQQLGITTVSPTSTNYVPFLVIPYVYQWNFSNTKVDGFWLGLYALTSPPTGAVKQEIHWRASGEGSAYMDQMVEDSWVDNGYDQSDTSFMTVDSDSVDDSMSDSGGIDGSDDGDFQ